MNLSVIEILESRIAPAHTLIAPNVVEYTDPDGDTVTVKTSKGTFDLATNFAFTPAGVGEQLQAMGLGSNFAKANLTVSVTAQVGDGKADVGFINAPGTDLGAVIVSGDLGRINVGDADPVTASLKTLKVDSFGLKGLTTQAAGGSLASLILGKVGKLTVVTNGIKNAFVNVYGGVDAGIGTVDITGDITGGANSNEGSLQATGAIKKLTVRGDLVGGGGSSSGSVMALGNIKKAFIDGDLKGGGGGDSGQVDSDSSLGSIHITGSIFGGTVFDSGGVDSDGDTKLVWVEGDIIGSSADETGHIGVDGNLKKVIIGNPTTGAIGSIKGGTVGQSGAIEVGGALGSLKVTGDIIGGSSSLSGSVVVLGAAKAIVIDGSLKGGTANSSGIVSCVEGLKSVSVKNLEGGTHVSATSSGRIFSGGSMSKVTVTGTILGGDGSGSGAISCDGTINKITIGGDLMGGSGSTSGSVFASDGIKSMVVTGSISSATGARSGSVECDGTIGTLDVKTSIAGDAAQPVSITARDAINKLLVGANVSFANILAGYQGASRVNQNASIGTVSIIGTLDNTNIVAGVRDVSADGFGNGDDTKINPDNDSIISTISSITVGAMVNPSAAQCGFTAEWVKSVKIGGIAVVLTPGANNDDPAVPIATNTTVREVPAV